MTNTEQLLERIAIALEAKPQMGFVGSNVQYVWVGWEGSTACWYTRQNELNVPIEETTVIGKLIGLKHKIKEFKGEKKEKLVIQLDCGNKKIYIESGLETSFSRSMLTKLCVLPSSLADQPITVKVKRGAEEGIVFCSIFMGDSPLNSEWDSSITCLNLLKRATEQLGFTSAIDAPQSETRGDLDRQITAEFRRLQDHGVLIESIRAMAIKKFPGFTKSTALSSQQAYQLLEMLKNVDIPL
jgi:hypothetical protein